MFYAHIVLAKKGPLARIWLAAHWDKKLTKAQVFETNIEQSVDGIMQPKVKLALRTSGHLLLGVVRIYSRKAKYLLADCNEAFVKIKMAFRPGMVDLPEEHREAAINTITLPEVFHDFDSALPEINDVDIEAQFPVNQSRVDEITMPEDYGSIPMLEHADYGNIGFEVDDDNFGPTIDENLMTDDINLHDPIPGTSQGFDSSYGDEQAGGLFEGELLPSTTLPRPNQLDSDDDDDDHFGDVGGVSPASPASSRGSPNLHSPQPGTSAMAIAEMHTNTGLIGNENDMNAMNQGVPVSDQIDEPAQENTLQDEESFALAPVDTTVLRGASKAKRKRKLIVDEVKNISGEEMKSQLANTTDIVTSLDLAPPTKRLMHWKEIGGVEKLFSLSARDLPSTVLFAEYQKCLITRPRPVEEFSMLGPVDVLGLNQHHVEHDSPSKRGRKRKQAAVLDATTVSEQQSVDISDILVPRAEQLSFVQPQMVSFQKEPSISNNLPHSIPDISNDLKSFPDNLPGLSSHPAIDNIENSESLPNLGADDISTVFNDLGDGLDSHGHDWNDDYDYMSTHDNQGVEQLENETDEQFEERVLNKRAAQLFKSVQSTLQKADAIYLSDMVYKNSRKQAAQKFYSLLVLKKFQTLELRQDQPYGDIAVMKGINFDNPKL